MPLKHIPGMLKFNPEKLNKINLFENPRFFCDVYCLMPGQEQKVHTHAAEDKVYYVLSGDVTFRDGVDDVAGAAGDALWAAAGEEHGVRNSGEANATLLVFMAPHPRLTE